MNWKAVGKRKRIMRRKPKEYWELQKTVIIESSDLP